MFESVFILLVLSLIVLVPIAMVFIIFGGLLAWIAGVVQILKTAKSISAAYADLSSDLPTVKLSKIALSTPLDFQYDMAGARLRAIGPVGIRYNDQNSLLKLRPTYLGDLKIEYRRSRMVGIGPLDIQYKRFSNQAKWIGKAELEYDRFGNRLIRVGDIDIQYEPCDTALFLGGRPKSIGSVHIQYNELRVHPLHRYYVDGFPQRLIGRSDTLILNEWMIIVIFFVISAYYRKIDEIKTD